MSTQDSRELSAITERWWRRNMVINAIVDTGFGFGISLLAISTIVAVFLKRMGASNTVVGLAPALATVAAVAAQLPATHWTRHFREKKTIFVAIHIASYLPWLAIGYLTLVWARPHPQRMIVALLGLMVVYAALLAASMPMWGQLLPRLFPDRKRGMAVGIIILAQGTAGVGGGLFAAYMLAHRPYPLNFATIFLTGGVCMVVARSLHLLSRESVPAEMPEAPREKMSRVVAAIWRADRRLRRFIFARWIFEAGAATGNFFAIYALARFGLHDQAAGEFALAANLGTAVVAPWLGSLGDRRGYRRVMGWGMALTLGATLLALGAPVAWVMLAAFFIAGLGGAADGVAYTNLLVEMGDERTRGYYFALATTGMAPLRLAAPLLWGLLSDKLGAALGDPAGALANLFAWSLALQALGWVALVALVDDPRRPGQRIARWRRGMGWPRFY